METCFHFFWWSSPLLSNREINKVRSLWLIIQPRREEVALGLTKMQEQEEFYMFQNVTIEERAGNHTGAVSCIGTRQAPWAPGSSVFVWLCDVLTFEVSESKLTSVTKRHAKSLQSCLTLCDPMDCSPPGSSIHGILQARILEWVASSSCRGSSHPENWTRVSYVSCVGRRVLDHSHHLGIWWLY